MRPEVVQSEDLADILAGVEPENQVDAEQAINQKIVVSQQQASDYDRKVILETKELVMKLLVAAKPIMTIAEAAEMADISSKRLSNIIYQIKTETGRFPDFVCDAGGVITRRIVRDSFLAWIQRSRKRGRVAA